MKKSVKYYQQVMNEIRQGQIGAGYFIYGEEAFLEDALLREISTVFLGNAQKEINFFLRYAPDTSLDGILSLTSGSGLFSEKKLIVYKDFQNLRNPDISRLAYYFKNASADICLIIVVRSDNYSTSKLEKIVNLEIVNIRPLRDFELLAFIRDEFKKNKKTITPEAAELLLFYVGDQMHYLQNQIQQIVEFTEEKSTIDEADIEEISGVYGNKTIFEFTKKLIDKNFEEAVFILRNLVNQGESPQSILFFVLRHLLILLKIRGYQFSGVKNDNEIQQNLKLYPKYFREYKNQLPKWKTPELQMALKILQDIDESLKSNRSSPDLLLDILSYKLVNLNKFIGKNI